MKQRKKAIGFYVLGDYLASVITWYGVFLFRKCFIEGEHFSLLIPFKDNNFFVGILIVPELWLFFHYITGSYTDLYRKSRLQELGKTLVVTFFGSIIIFFLLLLNDSAIILIITLPYWCFSVRNFCSLRWRVSLFFSG
jgi:hypothetical protein